MERNRIFVIGAFPPPTGGMETVMEQMFSLKFRAYELIPINVTKSDIIKSSIVINVLNFAYRCLKLAAFILFLRPKIVHIHASTDYGFWQKAVFNAISRMMGRKTILHMHGAEFKEFYGKISARGKKKIKETLDGCDAIIALSEGWRRYYSHISSNKNIFVIKNVVEIRNGNRSPAMRGKKPFAALFLGRVCRRKGAYDLQRAIAGIEDPEIRFLFVGPIDEENVFRRNMSKLGIEDRCEVLGEVTGNARFKHFRKSDSFVLPSYAEGLPIAMLEAMSFGLPIIATKVGAIPEVIGPDNGILIEPGNVKALKEAILKLSKDSHLRESMGKNNLTLIREEYSIERFKNAIEKLYGEVLG